MKPAIFALPLMLSVCAPALAGESSTALTPTAAAAAKRAEEEGDKVYKWILVNAASRPPAPAAAAPAPKPKPAPRAVATHRAAEPAAAPPKPLPGNEPVTVAVAERITSAPHAPDTAAQTLRADAAGSGDAPEQTLVVLERVEPDFPPSIVKRLQSGAVRIGFEVQPDGSVKAAEVIESDSARLNAAAVAAVAKWKFKPLAHAQHGEVQLVFNSDSAHAAR